MEEKLTADQLIEANIAKYNAEQTVAETKEEPVEKPDVTDEQMDLTQEEPKEATEEVEEAKEEVKEEEKEVQSEDKQEKQVPEEKASEETEAAAVIKIDGKEVTLTEKQLIDYAQKGYTADERFQKAAIMKRDAERKDAAAKILYNGLSQKELRLQTIKSIIPADELRDLCEEYLTPIVKQEFELAAMSDEQREAHLAKQEAEKYRNEIAQHKKQQEQAKFNAEVQAYEQSIQQRITQLLKTEKLPENPTLVHKIQNKMIEMLDNGIEDPDVTAAFKAVREDMLAERSLYDALPKEEKKIVNEQKANMGKATSTQKRRASIPQGRVHKIATKSPVRQNAEVSKYLASRIDLPLLDD